MRLMIVENEILLAMDLEDVLAELGHEVVAVASSSAEAVAAAARHRPDAVVMDINLGRGPDGIETAKHILTFLGIRSIFISAYHDGEHYRRGQSLDPIGFLSKPVDIAALRQLLDALPATSTATQLP